jgi:hypothetical protein
VHPRIAVPLDQGLDLVGAVVRRRQNLDGKSRLPYIGLVQRYVDKTVLVSVPESVEAREPVISRPVPSFIGLKAAEECPRIFREEVEQRSVRELFRGFIDREADVAPSLVADLLRVAEACQLPGDVVEGRTKVVDELADHDPELGVGFISDAEASDVAAGFCLELDGDSMRVRFLKGSNLALNAFEVPYGPLPLEAGAF